MARGHPALVSTAFGAPLLVAGGYLLALQSRYPIAGGGRAPPAAGAALALFGGFVIAVGLYVHRVGAPEPPTMRDGERLVDQRDPAQRNALAQAALSVPLLGVGFYLLYFTGQPYLYAALPLAAGLYLFSTGLHRYWRNTLTTYLVTNRRVMEEYRFLSLVRNELPLDKVRAVEERRTMWDSLFGLGRVYVRAGSTGDLTVTAGEVYDSTEFADGIRAAVGADPAGVGDVSGSGDGNDDVNESRGAAGVGGAAPGADRGPGATSPPSSPPGDGDDPAARSGPTAESTAGDPGGTAVGGREPGDRTGREEEEEADPVDPIGATDGREPSDSVPTTDGGSVVDRRSADGAGDDP